MRIISPRSDGLNNSRTALASSYSEGILGHDDILRLTPACVALHPLLRRLVASRFPFIFVDESQDTNPEVVEALRAIACEQPRLCVGFFGDPMQKIYTTGAGAVALNEGWKEITKPENFRCPTSVSPSVINRDPRQTATGLRQTRGRTKTIDGVEQSVAGTANLFILPADVQRSARLSAVRAWLAAETGDQLWLERSARRRCSPTRTCPSDGGDPAWLPQSLCRAQR